MKNAKKVLTLLLTLVMILSLAACGGTQAPAATEAPAEQAPAEQAPVDAEPLKIGFANFDVGNTWCVELAEGVKSAGERDGLHVSVDYCSADAVKQVEVIENYITMGYDVIMLVAVDVAAVEEPLKRAQEAGIKVIASAIETTVYDVYVSAKEEDMGFEIGNACGIWLNENKGGTGKVAVLDYPELTQTLIREQAMLDSLKAACPGAEVVMQIRASTPEEGLNAGETILQKYPDIDAIIGYNDSGALGASAAVEASGRDVESIFIGGIDATAEALEKINANNFYNASVDNAPFQNGEMLVDISKSLCAGEPVEKMIPVPLVLVDRTNIAEYMD